MGWGLGAQSTGGFVIQAMGISDGIFDLYGDLPVAVMWIIYALLLIGVWRLRITQPNAVRLVRVPVLPLFVMLALLGIGYALYGFLLAHLGAFALSLLVASLGLVVYARSSPREQ